MADSLIEYISCKDGKHFMKELEKHGRVRSLDEIKGKDSSAHHLVVARVKHVYQRISDKNATLVKFVLRECPKSKRKPKLFFGFVFNKFVSKLKNVSIKAGDFIAFRSAYIENNTMIDMIPGMHHLQLLVGFHSKQRAKIFLMKLNETASEKAVSKVTLNQNLSTNYNNIEMYKYTKICGITRPTPQMKDFINIYGVVTGIIKEAIKEMKHGIVSVVDETSDINNKDFLVNIFFKNEATCPAYKENDIIRFHRVKVERFGDRLDGRVFRASDIVVFPPDTKDQEGARSTAQSYHFTRADATRLAELRNWIATKEQGTVDSVPDVTVERGETVIKDIKEGGRYNIVCKIMEKQIISDNTVVLNIVDGTQEPKSGSFDLKITVKDPPENFKEELKVASVVVLRNVSVMKRCGPRSAHHAVRCVMSGPHCAFENLSSHDSRTVELKRRLIYMDEVLASVPVNTAEEGVVLVHEGGRTQESELEAGGKSDKTTNEIVPGSSKSNPELPKKNFKKTYPLSPKGKCFTANSKGDFSKLMVDLHKRICKVHCTRLESSSRVSESSPMGELVNNLIDLSALPDSLHEVVANRNKENSTQNKSLKISKRMPSSQIEVQIDGNSQQPGTYDSHPLQSYQAASGKRNSARREYQASDSQEQIGKKSQECDRQVRTEGVKKRSEHKENTRLQSEDQVGDVDIVDSVLRSGQHVSDNLRGINTNDNVAGMYNEFSDVTRNPEVFTSTQFNECATASCQSEVVPSSRIHEEEEDLQFARRSESYRHFNSLVCERNSLPSVSDVNDSLRSAGTRANKSTQFTGVMEVDDSQKEIDVSAEKNCSKLNSSRGKIKRIENIKKNIQMKSPHSSVLGKKLQKMSNCLQDVRKTKVVVTKSKQALSNDVINNLEERSIYSGVLYQRGKCRDDTQDSSMDVPCEERENDAGNRERCDLEVMSCEEQHDDEENEVDTFVGTVSRHSRSEHEVFTCLCNRLCADGGVQFASGSFKESQLREYCFHHIGDHLDESCVVRGWLRGVEPSITNTFPMNNIVSGVCRSCGFVCSFMALDYDRKSRRANCNMCLQKGIEVDVELQFIFRLHLIDEADNKLVANVTSNWGNEFLGCSVITYIEDPYTFYRVNGMLYALILPASTNVPVEERGPVLKLVVTPVQRSGRTEVVLHNTFLFVRNN